MGKHTIEELMQEYREQTGSEETFSEIMRGFMLSCKRTGHENDEDNILFFMVENDIKESEYPKVEEVYFDVLDEEQEVHPTKATFKALREAVGLPQQALADELGVHVRSVKRWEGASTRWYPPQPAWDILERMKYTQDRQVEYSLEIAEEQRKLHGIENPRVVITYFYNQAMFDEYGRDEGRFTVTNATARATAIALTNAGFDVVFAYPTEDEAINTL